MASGRTATTHEGVILDQHENDSFPNYDDFQKDLQKYTDTENVLIEGISKSVIWNVPELFRQLVSNFKAKDKLIRRCISQLETEILKLTQESNEPRSYQTELNKLVAKKLHTFVWILKDELKREELNKQEALKKFMAQCANNDLATETLE